MIFFTIPGVWIIMAVLACLVPFIFLGENKQLINILTIILGSVLPAAVAVFATAYGYKKDDIERRSSEKLAVAVIIEILTAAVMALILYYNFGDAVKNSVRRNILNDLYAGINTIWIAGKLFFGLVMQGGALICLAAPDYRKFPSPITVSLINIPICGGILFLLCALKL